MTTSSRSTTNPWVVWVVGLLVYVLAVFHRSSHGVAGLVAAERFDTTFHALDDLLDPALESIGSRGDFCSRIFLAQFRYQLGIGVAEINRRDATIRGRNQDFAQS